MKQGFFYLCHSLSIHDLFPVQIPDIENVRDLIFFCRYLGNSNVEPEIEEGVGDLVEETDAIFSENFDEGEEVG